MSTDLSARSPLLPKVANVSFLGLILSVVLFKVSASSVDFGDPSTYQLWAGLAWVAGAGVGCVFAFELFRLYRGANKTRSKLVKWVYGFVCLAGLAAAINVGIAFFGLTTEAAFEQQRLTNAQMDDARVAKEVTERCGDDSDCWQLALQKSASIFVPIFALNHVAPEQVAKTYYLAVRRVREEERLYRDAQNGWPIACALSVMCAHFRGVPWFGGGRPYNPVSSLEPLIKGVIAQRVMRAPAYFSSHPIDLVVMP